MFGEFFGETKYLPYAVDGFFGNGGKRCFVARIVDKEGALSAAVDLGSVTINAVGEGLGAIASLFRVKAGVTEPNGFTLQVHYWAAGDLPSRAGRSAAHRRLRRSRRRGRQLRHAAARRSSSRASTNLVARRGSPDYVEKRVANGLSMLIELRRVAGQRHVPAPGALTLARRRRGRRRRRPGRLQGARRTRMPLTGQRRSGLAALDEPSFEDVAILYAPNAFDEPGLPEELMTHCENDKYRFLILDSPRGPGADRRPSIRAAVSRRARASQYAAFYYPWIKVFDADSGARKLVPPGGHMAGIYARTDIERGVFKAPANEIVRGALELEFEVTDGGQGDPQSARRQRHPCLPRPRTPHLGRADALRQHALEVRQRAAPLHLHRGVDLPRHAVGGLRAQRPAAVGTGQADDHRVPAHAVAARARCSARRKKRRSSSGSTAPR